MKPLIGITAHGEVSPAGTLKHTLGAPYVDRIREAGGTPMILPFAYSLEEAREILKRVDGLMLTGGNDIDPKRWNETKHPKAELLHPVKEASDFYYARASLDADKTTFGICLGSQVLNVVQGGSLHQHMADLPKIHEAHVASEGKFHSIEVFEGMLQGILSFRQGKVNSYHHQAYNKIGEGLKVAARAEDGIPEALVSLKHRFVLGVQWHPERMADDAAQRRLFEVFVQNCR
jgi:putative glutamine amidotransferase